jgi:hypothetical protein
VIAAWWPPGGMERVPGGLFLSPSPTLTFPHVPVVPVTIKNLARVVGQLEYRLLRSAVGPQHLHPGHCGRGCCRFSTTARLLSPLARAEVSRRDRRVVCGLENAAAGHPPRDRSRRTTAAPIVAARGRGWPRSDATDGSLLGQDRGAALGEMWRLWRRQQRTAAAGGVRRCQPHPVPSPRRSPAPPFCPRP